jgi:4'-phosphopantetheinyl transferase
MILANMNTDEIQWRQAAPGKLINSNEVHVWRVLLDVTTAEFESLLGFLSGNELVRAARFHFERDQKRFIVARGILRKILGCYLNKHPGKICFEYSSHGKPMLARNPNDDSICFNLSHSGSLALYAVTLRKKIGIDIESIRDDVSVGQVAQQFFSQNEISSLEKIDINKRSGLFFQYWTRKEAFLKARGEGISFPMEQCDVSLISGGVLSPVTVQDNNREISSLYIQDLFPGNGYAAAIAIEDSDCNISCLHYSL